MVAGGVEGAGARSEEVEGADDIAAQAQWNTVHRAEPLFERSLLEAGPFVTELRDVGDSHRDAGGEAFDARTGAITQLHRLDQHAALAGGGDDRELAVAVSEHDACGRGVEKFGAGVDKRLQQIYHVVARHQCVCKSDEGRSQPSLSRFARH